MSNVYDIALEFRAALLRQDASAAQSLVRSYGLAYAKITKSLAQLLIKIETARARKEPIDRAWLLREERYNALLEQIQAEMNRFAKFANKEITSGQKAAIHLSEKAFSAQMTTLGLQNFNRLSTNAVETMVGMAGDGSPLADLLRPLGQQASQSVRDALVNGVAIGQSPRKTASEIKDALAGNLTRALAISRNEQLRAYRESSRKTYQANDDVCRGWRWTANLTTRSCVVCWAMDGTEHALTEPMATHPQCRCVQTPLTKTFAELGITSVKDEPARPTGIEAFAKLSEAEQLAILGKAKFAAYKTGQLKLQDVVGASIHPRWGKSRYERSLRDALRGEAPGAVPTKPQPLPVGPAGIPVSNALTTPKRGKLADIARNALQAINQVHGDGELPTIPLESDRSTKRQGGFWYYLINGKHIAQKITISAVGNTYPDVAVVHEVGHFLDQQGIGAKQYASISDPRMAAWRKAIEGSRALAELKQLAATSGSPGVSRTHVTYLGQWHELWARSYSQYIALRSNNKTMLDQINLLRARKGRVYYPRHWDDDDFEPIAQAFDELMLTLGWRQ